QESNQHARVVIDRITSAVSTAYSAPDHPGMWVVYETSGSHRFPDTLIVWKPEGTPANLQGPPLVRECLIYSPDPDSPNRLLEIRAASNATPIPLNDTLNSSTWRA